MTSKAFSASLGFGLNVKKKSGGYTTAAGGGGGAKPAMGKGASAIFGDDSDEDDEGDNKAAPTRGGARSDRAGVNYMMLQEAARNKSDKRIQQTWQSAVAEDATVFQYDEVYDKMEQTKTVESMRRQEAKTADKRPKYIDALMDNARRKKLQDELRDERIAQKEREREGAEFSDKDVFVTGAYKKKLEELKKAAEEERQKELEEARNDVTKRGDLSDLYRNMFKNKQAGGSAYKGSDTTEATPSSASPKAGPAKEPARASTASRSRSPLPSSHRSDRHVNSRDGDERSPRRVDRGGGTDRQGSEPRHHRADDGHRRSPSPPPRSPGRKRDAQAVATDDASSTAAGGSAPKNARKVTDDDVQDAKARYLARKAAKGKRPLPTFDA